MQTVFTVILLIVFGFVSNFLSLFLLNFAGIPGAIISGKPEKRSKNRFIFGSVISALVQSYVYLVYVAFIVSWTKLAASRPDVIAFVIWPFAFLTVVVPVYFNLIRARVENKEQEHASAQVEALHITVLISFIGFFVFVFFDNVMNLAWSWVPYVND